MLGQNIQQYQILERLGAGGMGEIFKAQDTRLNRIVAIKVLSNSTDPEQRRRFIQEAQAASSLNHPNIVVIHDILSEGDDQFMVMEFVNGKTLGELIPPTGLSVRTTLNYAVQAADGLHAAHTAGIIHRDLKPGNLMVNTHGTVKILDFGLAKVTFPTGSGVSLSDITGSIGPAPMTVQGSILGTLSYMSPEQAQGVKVDARTDIFSFGCVLHEMLTGRKAFAGDTNLAILTSVMRDNPPLVSDIVPAVPLDLGSVVRRALSKKPADRWQSMEEMHAALLALKVRSDSTMLTGAAQLPTPRRRPWIALATIVLMLAATGFGGMWWWNTRHAAPLAPHTDAPGTQTDKSSTMPPVALTNQSILDMMHAKVPPSVIVSQIRSSQTSFNLSTPEIIRLSKEDVPEVVLQAMRDPKGTGNPATAAGDVPPTTEPASRAVQVPGGVPFEMTLEADVPTDCEPGQALRFRVRKDVSVDDAVVVAKGATVTGVIVEGAKRKMVVQHSRPTFRLLSVEAVDGSRLKVRATAGRLGDSRKDPALEPLGGTKAKNVLAPAGSRFLAWFDGDQTITVRR